MLIKEIISEIVNDLRALGLDDRVSKRYILSKLKDNAALFIKRENDLYRLFNYQDIWTTIDCLEMEQSNQIECCCISIDRCKSFMRSKHKLPTIYTYKGGPLIREVMSIDGTFTYQGTTPLGYKRILDREFKDKSLRYYWFENEHLVIPDSEVNVVRLTAYFRDVSKLSSINSCNEDENNKCINPLEEEFQCPSHLLSTVKTETINNLFHYYKRNVLDTNPNNDLNMKQGKQNQ